MKICLIAPHYPPMSFPCGAADFSFNFVQELKSAGNEMGIIHSNLESMKDPDVDHMHLDQNIFFLFNLFAIKKWVEKKKFEIVDIQFEVFMYRRNGWILLLPLFFYLKKVKFVLTIHSMYLPRSYIFTRLEEGFWRCCQLFLFDKVVFYSEKIKQDYSSRFPNKSSSYFTLGFPSNMRVLPRESVRDLIHNFQSKNIKQFVYFGHINQGRGIEAVMNAFKSLSSTNPFLRLVLMSQFKPEENTYHRDLLSWVRVNGLESVIQFTGRVDDEAVSLILQSSDFAILPFPEGACFKNGSLAAAIMNQLPVLTTRNEITEKSLLDCKGISYFGFDNVKQIEDAIRSALTMSLTDEIRIQLRTLSHFFSWQYYIENRIRIYQG